MAFWMVALVAMVVLGTLLVHMVRDQSIEREQVSRRLHDPGTPRLEYVVPTGQDPVVVLAVLERAGYTATVDPSGAHQVVMVQCRVDRDRERVRSLIESANVTALHEGMPISVAVRFRDEA